jgi:hypothetical protein
VLVCHRCRNSPRVLMIERERDARFDFFDGIPQRSKYPAII